MIRGYNCVSSAGKNSVGISTLAANEWVRFEIAEGFQDGEIATPVPRASWHGLLRRPYTGGDLELREESCETRVLAKAGRPRQATVCDVGNQIRERTSASGRCKPVSGRGTPP